VQITAAGRPEAQPQSQKNHLQLPPRPWYLRRFQ
jgi:hypothetical protein